MNRFINVFIIIMSLSDDSDYVNDCEYIKRSCVVKDGSLKLNEVHSFVPSLSAPAIATKRSVSDQQIWTKDSFDHNSGISSHGMEECETSALLSV